ncbi:hypothetical protein ONZ45_g11930 [Pleurotus djamor]|nr:hypothetical protein ONZ45_g11930 [Pleurotus djamor]
MLNLLTDTCIPRAVANVIPLFIVSSLQDIYSASDVFPLHLVAAAGMTLECFEMSAHVKRHRYAFRSLAYTASDALSKREGWGSRNVLIEISQYRELLETVKFNLSIRATIRLTRTLSQQVTVHDPRSPTIVTTNPGNGIVNNVTGEQNISISNVYNQCHNYGGALTR